MGININTLGGIVQSPVHPLYEEVQNFSLKDELELCQLGAGLVA